MKYNFCYQCKNACGLGPAKYKSCVHQRVHSSYLVFIVPQRFQYQYSPKSYLELVWWDFLRLFACFLNKALGCENDLFFLSFASSTTPVNRNCKRASSFMDMDKHFYPIDTTSLQITLLRTTPRIKSLSLRKYPNSIVRSRPSFGCCRGKWYHASKSRTPPGIP